MQATDFAFKKSLLDFVPAQGIDAECVVIGSGAGGALTAQFLVEKGREVLILEEGPFIEFEDGQCGIANTFPRVWREGGAIPIMSNTSLVFGEGRCLGGSTQLNAGLLNRTPPEILEHWRNEYRIRDLETETMNKYQERIEQSLFAHTTEDAENPMGRILRAGAERTRYKGVEVPVAAQEINGRKIKQSMQHTFLKDAVLAGVKFIVNCRVERINTAGTRAGGVTALWRNQGRTQRILIRCKYIFVCAGTIQSSLLLRRSGVKKNVGSSVQFHPTLRVLAEFNELVSGYAHEMPSFQIKEFAPLLTMGASLTSPPYIAAGLALDWEHQKQFMEAQDRMAIFYVGVKSRALGTARNIPFGRGSYIVRYSLLPEDAKNLGFGYAKLCELLFAAGAKRLFPAITGAGVIENFSAVKRFLSDSLLLKNLNLVTIHSYGSCPMGERENGVALDSYGKLRGFDNIYVNDASMLPTSPGVNPQGPIMALALRNMEKNFG
ncbi:MAG: GMC family oxidoreductase [Candidatus Sungbacteria bacterium]|nr:GMC family oxidoreductase [Candidatus Sungbacteria bacterium]